MQLIDRAFGVSPQAMTLRAQRFEMLSANLANSDTPGYKAVDMDFRAAMSRANQMSRSESAAHPGHIALSGNNAAQEKYRVPMQRSLDGNTVETEQEHAAFMDNAVRYQASVNFLDGRIRGLIRAFRGE